MAIIGLTVTLSHASNPDVDGGYWDEPVDPPTPKHVLVSSLARAQEVARAYIERNGLGGGNWTGGTLMLDGKAIGHISYNGRAWHGSPRDWGKDSREMLPADPALGCYALGAA